MIKQTALKDERSRNFFFYLALSVFLMNLSPSYGYTGILWYEVIQTMARIGRKGFGHRVNIDVTFI